MKTGSSLKARYTGRQRNRTADVSVLTVLSLATRSSYKSRAWVGHADLYAPSFATARHARHLCLGDGLKGEQCSADAEMGESKKMRFFA